MFSIFLSRIVLIFFFILSGISQGNELPRVDSPQQGEKLVGEVIISGNTAISGFARTEVYFGYPDMNGWFLISSSDQPVRNGPIASWDTTTIVDGVYRLKVTVYLVDGSYAEVIVPNLLVSNHVIAPTVTMQSDSAIASQTIGANEPIKTLVIMTATALPTNPATVSENDLFLVILFVSLAVMAGFLVWLIGKRFTSKRED